MLKYYVMLRDGDWLTLERVKAFAIVSASFWAMQLIWDFYVHTRFGVVSATGEQLGRDFVNYWAAARLAISGKAILTYHINDFLAFERSLTAANAEFKWYSYPPVTTLLALPFGLLPFAPAFAAWTLAGWVLLTRMLAHRMGWITAAVALLATPGFVLDISSGQNGAFSAAFLAGGVLLLDRRPLLAGVLFGLLCYKPHLGVLIPVALLVSGKWRTVLAAGATTFALVGASVLLVGWDVWAAFIHNAPINRSVLETISVECARMPTVYTAARLLGASNALAYVGQFISGIFATLAVIIVWRGAASTRLKSAALIIATFLVTPYAWDYDTVVLLFVAIWYWDYATEAGWHPWEKLALAVMISFPALVITSAISSHLQIGPLVYWLVLVLLVRRAISEHPAVTALLVSPRNTQASIT
jgi:arabinofuranan 3-O-arabinosyltransferase